MFVCKEGKLARASTINNLNELLNQRSEILNAYSIKQPGYLENRIWCFFYVNLLFILGAVLLIRCRLSQPHSKLS